MNDATRELRRSDTGGNRRRVGGEGRDLEKLTRPEQIKYLGDRMRRSAW